MTSYTEGLQTDVLGITAILEGLIYLHEAVSVCKQMKASGLCKKEYMHIFTYKTDIKMELDDLIVTCGN